MSYPIFCGWAPFQERHTLKWSRELFAGASSTGARPNGSSDATWTQCAIFLGEHKVPLNFMLLLLGKIFGNSFFFRWQNLHSTTKAKGGRSLWLLLLIHRSHDSFCRAYFNFSTTLHNLFVDRRAPEYGWPETGHENFWTRTRHLAARQTGWRSLSGGHCTYWQRRPSAYAERAEQLAIFVPVAVAFAVWEGEILGNT